MNQNELEQRIREKLGDRQFPPDERGWERLQAALPRSADEPPAGRDRKIIFLLPMWGKIAASVAALITAGTIGYFAIRQQPYTPASTAVATQKAAPAKAAPQTIVPPVTDTHDQTATQSSSITPSPLNDQPIARQPERKTQLMKDGQDVRIPLLPQQPEHVQQVPEQQIAVTHPEPVKQQQIQSPQADPIRQQILQPDLPIYPQEPQEIKNGVNIGVAALVGKVSVGNMNYQLGVVAHQQISDKVFAETTLALAATDVSYTQSQRFNGVATGNQLVAGVSYSRVVNTEYRQNVISMGVAPAIGYKVTRQISLSVGGAVYRNFNQSLNMQEDDEITKAAASSDATGTPSINIWDAGLTGGAEYKVTKKISINAQYRYGLSNYINIENRTVRNSGMNVGLKCLFGK